MGSGNDVSRLEIGNEVLFLKVPTKDLEAWPDPLNGAAVKVNREATAHLLLGSRGLPAVEVVGVELSQDNPLGRPYLVTRRASGDAFTTVVPRSGEEPRSGPLEAVGQYLASTGSIELANCGFLENPQGDVDPQSPAPPRGSHDPEVEQSRALRDLATARPYTPEDLYDKVHQMLSGISVATALEYKPPRLVLGAVHPNHPFLTIVRGDWVVSACIDLELASAGNPLVDDVATFAFGMMFHFRDAYPWWEALFGGYGVAPSLERFQLILLSSCSYCFGPSVGMENISRVYRAILMANSWSDLFSADRAVR